nr:uncharacterized mitochondrial protein AtMg00810-like [Tanacetum cinerariifolium]
FGALAEILSRSDGEEIQRCYIDYLEVLVSYYKTARSSRDPTRGNEDLECFKGYRCDGNMDDTMAAKKGKGKVEHFGITLEEEGNNKHQYFAHQEVDQKIKCRKCQNVGHSDFECLTRIQEPFASSSRQANNKDTQRLDKSPLQTYSRSKQRTRMVVGESSQPPVKDTTLTFQCPILTSTNYTMWRMPMEVLLGIHEMLDNGTIDEYATKLSGIASKSATLGEVMSEHKLVKRFLTSLPRRFSHIVAALEQVLDLKTTGFEDVVGRLKAYKERVKEEDKANDPQEDLLYARTEYSNGNNDSSGGRGRGSYSRGCRLGRGQGRSRDNSQNQGQRDSLKNHEVNEQKEKYTPPKSESNTDGNEDVWYFDNGASNHMTGNLLIKVPRSANRLYKAQLNVGKEGTNEVGRESDEMVNPHSSLVIVHETNPDSEEDKSRSDDKSIPIARLETIRLLIALAAGKGWKIHHLNIKTKVSNREFIIIAVYGDDIFVTGTSLDLVNKFKKRMACQFEMSDLGELTYYLGIEVSQGKDCVEIKEERYAMKILKEAGMEDCNPALCPMEPGLKLSKAEDEPEVEATQYQKCNDMKLVGYSDSSHNIDIDDGRSTTGHVFYLGTSPITWCSQKKIIMALSSCEAEFVAATATACQAIWLREL